jgi:peptide chain release factor 2
MAIDGFWNDQELAQSTVSELKRVKASLKPVLALDAQLEEFDLMFELVSEEDSEEGRAELDDLVSAANEAMGKLEFRIMLGGEYDSRDTYLTVQAGAGGTESCDWAEMLLRMYARWAERSGFELEVTDRLDGEEAGVKWATLLIKGDYAYGYLKAESGVHRLVRISPFDSQNRRQTSFAAVEVMPVLDAAEVPEIRPEDLRVNTYRAGGAGGQHVNKTDSAVRLTHLETGIVVACQSERSQYKNRSTAMKMLAAKLFAKAEADREAELAGIAGVKGDIGWGHQIRSYVLHPYQMVKDHRTNLEMGNTGAVLDGDIQQFIETFLRSRSGSAAPKGE